MVKYFKHPITRREFIQAAGIGLAGLAGSSLACRLGHSSAIPPTTPTHAYTPASFPAATATTAAASTAAATQAPSPTPHPTAPPELAADLFFHNGSIITVDTTDRIVQAVAVKNGKIQAVGKYEEAAILVGENTQVIDLAGRAMTPGMVDAHNHFQVMGLMNTFYIPLLPPDVRSMEDMRAKLAERIAQLPAGEWVQGYFIAVNEGRLPTRLDLDPVSPENPVWIMQQGGHYGSANSLALQIAGITRDTPDPEGGLIERDERGDPTGVFYNHRAMDVLRRYAPTYPPETIHQNIASTLPLFAACGVTSFQDNNVRGVDNIAAYLDAGRNRELYLRGAVFYTLEWPSDLDRALKEIEYYQDDGFMRFAGFKFLLDGQLKMAYCHQPHNGVSWEMPTWEPQSFKDAVKALHDTGLQICVHCAGDAAADLTLDAFEAAMNANPRPDPRHRIEHAILTTPQATQRMKDLGVVVCTQPQFIRLGGDMYPELFGEERAKRVIVTREWLDSGVALALSSDSPTTPWYTPQVTLFGAATRITYSNQFFEPDQAITVQEALRAHTMGSAYAGHMEHVKGSIEVGKLADLAVWNQNPLTMPLNELWNTPIDMTIVGGEIVYTNPAASLQPQRAAAM